MEGDHPDVKAGVVFNTAKAQIASGDPVAALQVRQRAANDCLVPRFHLVYLNKPVASQSLLQLLQSTGGIDAALPALQRYSANRNSICMIYGCWSGYCHALCGTLLSSICLLKGEYALCAIHAAGCEKLWLAPLMHQQMLHIS